MIEKSQSHNQKARGKECTVSLSELLVFILGPETVTSASLLHILSALNQQRTPPLPTPTVTQLCPKAGQA